MMLMNLLLIVLLGLDLVQVKTLLKRKRSTAHAASVMASLLLLLFASMLL